MATFKRIQISLALLVTTFIVPVLGQQTKNADNTTKCHARIVALDRLGERFTEKSLDELGELRTFLETCVASFALLSKSDLSKAALELEWVQYAIDQHPDAKDPSESGAVIQEAGMLKTGQVRVSPLELGSSYRILLGTTYQDCDVVTTDEMSCLSAEAVRVARWFTGAIITQGGRRYLIGCIRSDDTCLRPNYGTLSIEIEGTTVRFLNYNIVTTDNRTGRQVGDSKPPFFTLLTKLD